MERASTRWATQEFYRRQELGVDDAHQGLNGHSHESDESRLIQRLDAHWLKGLRVLAQYHGNRDMALDCFLLAHGLGEMIGIDTAVGIAVKHFANPKKKAAVTKCIQLFRDCLGLPPAPGQRSENGRKTMTNARKRQLNGAANGH